MENKLYFLNERIENYLMETIMIFIWKLQIRKRVRRYKSHIVDKVRSRIEWVKDREITKYFVSQEKNRQTKIKKKDIVFKLMLIEI